MTLNMHLGGMIGTLLFSALVLGGAAANSINAPVQVAFGVHTHGCGASNPGQPIFLLIVPADKIVGSNEDTQHLEFRSGQLTAKLAPGYYSAELTGRGCWEEAQWFSVLPATARKVTLLYDSFEATPDTDYFLYYPQYSGIAGTIPAAVTRVELISSDLAKAGKPDYVITPDIVAGAYYADQISPGRYTVRAYTPYGTKDSTIIITQNKMRAVNFTLGDFNIP
jgi:hypothetical protein